jgi:hypothetical protein
MTKRALIAHLRRLERAARPSRARPSGDALRNAVIASTEQFLERLDDVGAHVETADKGLGLLDAPIRDIGISIAQALAHVEHDVVRPGAASGPGYLAYIRRWPLPLGPR